MAAIADSVLIYATIDGLRTAVFLSLSRVNRLIIVPNAYHECSD